MVVVPAIVAVGTGLITTVAKAPDTAFVQTNAPEACTLVRLYINVPEFVIGTVKLTVFDVADVETV